MAKRTIWSQELKVELKSTKVSGIDNVKEAVVLLQLEIDELITQMQTSSPNEIPTLAVILADKTRLIEQECGLLQN